MGRAILIRLTDAPGDDTVVGPIAERIGEIVGALGAVDVIGWPPARDEIDRLTDTS